MYTAAKNRQNYLKSFILKVQLYVQVVQSRLKLSMLIPFTKRHEILSQKFWDFVAG